MGSKGQIGAKQADALATMLACLPTKCRECSGTDRGRPGPPNTPTYENAKAAIVYQKRVKEILSHPLPPGMDPAMSSPRYLYDGKVYHSRFLVEDKTLKPGDSKRKSETSGHKSKPQLLVPGVLA